MSHVTNELVAYHFGICDDENRKRVEDHLATCRECLLEFLDIKRAIETEGPGPSRNARERLRNAVFSELHPQPKRARWERPLAFAIAAWSYSRLTSAFVRHGIGR